MAAEADPASEPRILFTAPWEALIVRRGDALGLRALADQFADAVAPGLSNRIRDGRWVTILAWCLVRSQAVFHASGGRSVVTRAEQRQRYAWLRPLELIWVARTIALAEGGLDRSLAGQRRVRPWFENDCQRPDRFGMSVEQFRSKVCEHLGRAFASDHAIRLLPCFSRLADAGMAVMDLVVEALKNDSRVELARVAGNSRAEPLCEELMAAAQEWQGSAGMTLRHVETAHRFAGAIPNARPIDCLRELIQHHEMYGGGLRWFVLRNDWIEPRTPPRIGSSRYRFRLWSLCRLAAQCGVLSQMPRAVRDDEPEEDEASEAGDE